MSHDTPAPKPDLKDLMERIGNAQCRLVVAQGDAKLRAANLAAAQSIVANRRADLEVAEEQARAALAAALGVAGPAGGARLEDIAFSDVKDGEAYVNWATWMIRDSKTYTGDPNKRVIVARPAPAPPPADPRFPTVRVDSLSCGDFFVMGESPLFWHLGTANNGRIIAKAMGTGEFPHFEPDTTVTAINPKAKP